MAISIKTMKGYVSDLQKIKRSINDFDSEISKIRSRTTELYSAVQADIQFDRVHDLLSAVEALGIQEKGVYSDQELNGAIDCINAEIQYLERAIRLKEEAERAMLAAQAELQKAKLQ